jgi:hypothetical protein
MQLLVFRARQDHQVLSAVVGLVTVDVVHVHVPWRKPCVHPVLVHLGVLGTSDQPPQPDVSPVIEIAVGLACGDA